MAYFNWNKSMSVENDEIDSQHKQWIDTIENFYQGIQSGSSKDHMKSLIKSMKDYTVFHFKKEEDYMERIGYPQIDDHIKIHQDFIKRVQDFEERFSSGKLLLSLEVTNFMKDWVVNHIMTADKKYAEYNS
jgi:hemerythrin-like metal-binding protein